MGLYEDILISSELGARLVAINTLSGTITAPSSYLTVSDGTAWRVVERLVSVKM